jgi:hypothetical protein
VSFIDHRCITCAHLATWHRGTTCSNRWCRCPGLIPDDPELVATVDYFGRAPNGEITKPGAWVFYPSNPTCACAECMALFEHLGGP